MLTTIRKTNPIQEALLKNKKVNIFLLSSYPTEVKDVQYYNRWEPKKTNKKKDKKNKKQKKKT